jgi:hypothetical protein
VQLAQLDNKEQWGLLEQLVHKEQLERPERKVK